MGTRLEFHTLLENVLGSKNVYFQPPTGVMLKYPCITYSRKSGNSRFANNSLYSYKQCYNLIVIDKNPDSTILDKVVKLPMCMFDRHYPADNLNHDTYTIYY